MVRPRGGRGEPARGRAALRLGRAEARQGARQRRRGRRGDLPGSRRGDRQHGRAVRRRTRDRRRARSRARARRCTRVQPVVRRAVLALPRAAQGTRGGADPRRHSGRGGGDPARARVGSARRRAHPRAVGPVPVVRARHLRPGLGGVRRAAHAGAHALGPRRAPGLRHRRGLLRDVRRRDAVVDGAAALVPAVRRCVRALPRAEVRGDGSGKLLGRRPALDARRHLQPQPRRAEDGQPLLEPHDASRATTSTATSRSVRRTRAGARSDGATRSASTTSCGATTSRIPKARGRTPASS